MDPEGFKLSNIQKATFLISFFVFLLFGFQVFAALCDPDDYPTDYFRACYYEGIALDGGAFLGFTDEGSVNSPVPETYLAIEHLWGDGAIFGGRSDDISAAWRGRLNFPTGRYQFTVQTDDGIRLFINENLIIDEWRDQVDSFAVGVDLNGYANIRLEWYENAGGAKLRLHWAKVSVPPSIVVSPVQIDFYVLPQIDTCIVGNPCTSADCYNTYNADGTILKSFEKDSALRGLKPSDSTIGNYAQSECFSFVMPPEEQARVIDNVQRVFQNVENRHTLGAFDITLRTITLGSVETELSEWWGGLWLASWNLRPLVTSYLTKQTDFVIATHGFNEFSGGVYGKYVGPPACGGTFGADWGVGGAGYSWVPQTKPGMWFECSTYYVYINEWLHQLVWAVPNLMGLEDIYWDDVNNERIYPPCGVYDPDTYKWFPSHYDLLIDPDSPWCGDPWGEHPGSDPGSAHLFLGHFDFSMEHYSYSPFYGNHCRNGVQDFGETGVDVGGNCSTLNGSSNCIKPEDGWNKAGTCTIDITYTDPTGGSDLEQCLYKTENGIPPTCTDDNWNLACSCSGQSSITCPVDISIGPTGYCNLNGIETCKICSKVVDGAGNEGYGEQSLNIDYTTPQTTIECNGGACLTGWYNADISITLSCSDSDSGCDKTYYCIDQTNSCSPGTLYAGTFNLITEGTNYVRYYSTDIAGNIEQPPHSKTIKLDKTGPVSQFTDVATPPAGSTVTSDFDVSVNDWDRPDVDNSGLAGCYYSIHDSGADWAEKSGETRNCNSDLSFTVIVNPGGASGDCRTIGGTCTVSVYAYDTAGNPGESQFRTFNISEATPPITTLDEYLPDPTNDNTPTYSGVSTDAQSQVVDIEYRVDEGIWIDVDSFTPALSVPFTFTPLELADGTYAFEVRAKDEVENWEQPPYPSDNLTIDTEAPTIGEISPTSTLVNVSTTFLVNVSDNIEVTNCWLYIFGGEYEEWPGTNDGEMDFSLPCQSCNVSKEHTFSSEGEYSLYAFCKDEAGNPGSGTPVIVKVTTPDIIPPYRVSWDPLSRDCTNADTDISVTIQYADLDSGMAETRYCWTEGASCTPTTLFANLNGGTATQPSTGSWTLCVEATDNAFSPNSITECEGTYIVDKQAPDYPSFNPSLRDWSNEDVSVIVTYTDNLCGITYTRHCWTEGASCEPGTTEASTFTNGTSTTKSDNGIWTLCDRARDGAGNWRNADCSGLYRIDKTLPSGTLTVTPDSPEVGQDITITISANDEESGINYLLAEDDGIYLPAKGCGGAASCDKSWIVQETVAGDHTYCGLIYDLADNVNNTTPYCLTITVREADTTPPYRVSWDPLSRDCTNANTDISVTIQYADLDSGMAETRYCWTTGASCAPTTFFANPNGGTTTQPSTGNWTLCVEATDNAFSPNSITECEGTYIVDKLPPNLPTFDPTLRDWSNEDVSVIVTYTDNLCGITYTRHCWTEGASCEPGTTEASTFTNGTSTTKSDNGIWTLCARARDGVGNWRSTDCFGPYQIDKEAPTVGAIFPTTARQGESKTFSASVQDEISQISVCWFFVERVFASAGVSYSDTPCTDCTVSVDYTFDETRDYDNVFFLCEDAAGNLNTVNPVTVHVEPPPSLSVDLVAVPPFGTGPLSNVDLIASVFGTITGTINYEFYCEDGQVSPTCDKIGVANTTYSLSQCLTDKGQPLSDLCDYTVTSIAKVFIERGEGCPEIVECTNDQECCQIRKVDIYIGGDQPPVCGISVPPITTVSTPIYIEVGSSYDPEGAMATVRFCSDKNPANPNDQCDESWTRNYDWNISEENWDATNKKMKWSFGETGTYEVWAEVEDSVGQSVSCYDTIDVTECIPGVDIKNCTSVFGCEHTLTCTAEGTWPSDCGPADECTPDSTQDCGINGFQTCNDSCIWGFCVEPDGCLWPPDECLICQHPVCLPGDIWGCEFDPAGTDCGDCRQCDGFGSCDYICDGTESSCECISDECRGCAEYYDPTGPTCGYQGVCSCGPLETPTWSCFGGVCQCTCNLDLINCAEPPPGCQEDYPGVAIIPSRQPGTAGTSLTYTVFVINLDEGQDCPDVTFNLTTGGICNDALWTCSLGLSQLVDIPPGQSDETTLTVTSPEPYSRGDYQISVTATRQ